MYNGKQTSPALTPTAGKQRSGRRTAFLDRIQRLATKPDLGEDHLLSAFETRNDVRTDGRFRYGIAACCILNRNEIR